MTPSSVNAALAHAEFVRLRQQLDARLALLKTPTAGDRLRRVMLTAPKLDGRVRAGVMSEAERRATGGTTR